MKTFNIYTFLRASLWLACTCALAWARPLPEPNTYDPHNPPQGTFAEQWSEFYLAEEKIGYAHERFTRKGDTIETERISYLRLYRGTQAVETHLSEHSVETVSGQPISIHTRTQQGQAAPLTLIGTVQGDQLILEKTQGEHIERTSVPLAEGTTFPWGTARQHFLRNFTQGEQYSLEAYSPDLRADAPLRSEVSVLGPDTLDYFGTAVATTQVRSTVDTGTDQITMLSWVDAHNRSLKTQYSSGTLPLIEYLSSREHATAPFQGAEVFQRAMIPITSFIPARAEEVLFKLRPLQGGKPLKLPESIAQAVTPQSDGSAYVRITRTDHKTLRERIPTNYPPELSPYLESNLLLQLDDPALKALLEQSGAMKHKRTSRRADKLRRFVSEFIEAGTLEVSFASSAEICRTPRGDCTEYAVLLAALGRLSGIPTRVASGLAYIPFYQGQEDLMGYHMWTQFYIDEQWVDFDSAANQSECSPTRIILATSPLKDGLATDLSFSLWDLIGRLEISILSTR